MSKEIIREEIDIIMETIVEQWETIKEHEGKIPFIEMDIFMENIRKLYNDLYLLDKMNKAPGIDPDRIKAQLSKEPSITFEPETRPKEDTDKESGESPEHTRQEAESVIDAEPEPELPAIDFKLDERDDEPALTNHEHLSSQSEPATEETPEIMVETESLPQSEPEKKEEFTTETADEPVQPTIETEAGEPEKEIPKQPAEAPLQKKPAMPSAPDLFGSITPSLADKYHAEKKSVKDQLTENGNDNSLGNKMQQSQIVDLKSAIGINDKFLFINELFKGDLAGYNRTIESLNLCKSRREAMDILEEMHLKYNWSENSSSFMRLTEFLKRRYTD